MASKITSLEAATTIGIDIGKNTFHLIGLDKKGAIALIQLASANLTPANGGCDIITVWVGFF